MRKIALLAILAGLFVTPARADFTAKDASAATITFKNPNACTSVVCVPVFQLMDSTGTNSMAIKAASTPPATTDPAGVVGIADGNAVTIGAKADAPCTLPATTTACSEVAVQKAIANAVNSSIPAGSAIIGKVGIDQTTPGTTNAVSIQYGSTASVADPCQTATKVYTPVNVATATNVIITAVAAKKKYICGIFLYPGGTDNIAVYQATTATSCATAAADIFGGHTTGTGFLTTATAGFSVGNGSSAIAATNTVNTDICITTSAAVQLSGVVVTVDQ